MKAWRPFDEARGFARSLQLKNVKEWEQYAKTDEKPNDIPAAPSYVYKNDGWKNWIDWLGNEDRIVSEETKRKMSEAAKGRKHSEEARRKMSEAWKNRRKRESLAEYCIGKENKLKLDVIPA